MKKTAWIKSPFVYCNISGIAAGLEAATGSCEKTGRRIERKKRKLFEEKERRTDKCWRNRGTDNGKARREAKKKRERCFSCGCFV